MDNVTLEGHHVLLEPLSLEHGPLLLEAATQSRDSYAFTNVPQDLPAMLEYVETALIGKENRTIYPFTTIDTKTGRVIGSTRFGDIQFWNWPEGSKYQRGEHLPDSVEIGWTWLAADAQRTGVNTEAKLLMLTLAFESWNVHRVRLRTDSRNERSSNAIERLGARFDGVVRADSAAFDGEIRDTAIYSIVDSEWPDVKNGLAKRLSV